MSERKLRLDARGIFDAGVEGADATAAVQRHFWSEGDRLFVEGRQQPYELDSFDNIYVIGAGKASGPMARAVHAALGTRVTGGLVNVKRGGQVDQLSPIELNPCGHPIPDEDGHRGAQKIESIARAAGEKDLVICVVSGGASALMPLSANGISLADKQVVNDLLIA